MSDEISQFIQSRNAAEDSEPLPEKKSFRLDIGCHSGTRTSRDSTSKPFDTLEQAIDSVHKSERFYASIGSYLWFAVIYGPDGNEVWRKAGTFV